VEEEASASGMAGEIRLQKHVERIFRKSNLPKINRKSTESQPKTCQQQ
jgi:hypothetical protein